MAFLVQYTAMDNNLHNKIVLVTGGNRKTGLAIVRRSLVAAHRR